MKFILQSYAETKPIFRKRDILLSCGFCKSSISGRTFKMSAKTTSSSSSSDISKKVHAYFASLSSTSARILDDVRSISQVHSRRQNHTFNPKTDSSKASSCGWDSLSEDQRAELVIESLVPGDLEQKYRSLSGNVGTGKGSLSWTGGPLGPLASFVDASQSFPLVEISTGSPLPSVAFGHTLASDTRGRGIVIEEDINGQKVPTTWRDEHAQAFSWYNQSCDPITSSRDAPGSLDSEESARRRFPPHFINLCGLDGLATGLAGIEMGSDAPEGVNCDHQPMLSRLSTSVSGGTFDSGFSNVTSEGNVFVIGSTDIAGGGGGGSSGRISRRSSRASTPERRRSPLMRPKEAPPPPPPVSLHHPNKNEGHQETERGSVKNRLYTGDLIGSEPAARQFSGRWEMSATKEIIMTAHSYHNGQIGQPKTVQAIATKSTSLQSPRSASVQPNGKKRQAPKPPVSPLGPTPEPTEQSSRLSLASVEPAASVTSASSASNANRNVTSAKWLSQIERPRSSFCPSSNPDQPHILPEALAPEITRSIPDSRASPLLQHVNAGLRPKVPPQQLKKVVPPVAPKFEMPRLGVKNSTDSIVTAPVVNDDIPKTGFDFLDNW
ncbi:hypothetical protein BIW11_05501 [Tropilaelaps mercedesae]|uniref:DUF4706 domain-containing protein n=1 Tax=Tropilaelaps mercedesae TaxID=418985 RepID=A0A1V9Y214_9ACAR|nr:hypothetical protein BIW11_05501 [Tropilaelaps mercedesae]